MILIFFFEKPQCTFSKELSCKIWTKSLEPFSRKTGNYQLLTTNQLPGWFYGTCFDEVAGPKYARQIYQVLSPISTHFLHKDLFIKHVRIVRNGYTLSHPPSHPYLESELFLEKYLKNTKIQFLSIRTQVTMSYSCQTSTTIKTP